MSYIRPLGDVASTDFNSTKYPGVCKPSTSSALVMFRELQKQLGRVASVKGLKPIAIDGDIGPGTVGLFKAVQNAAQADANSGSVTAQELVTYNNTSCTIIATSADDSSVTLKNYADFLNAPSSPPTPPPAKPPTLVLNTGQEVPAPMSADIMQAWTGLGGTGQLVALAALGGIGWYMLKGSKKKPVSPPSRRR